jgi:SagB-type dehydrogenase family enzyme
MNPELDGLDACVAEALDGRQVEDRRVPGFKRICQILSLSYGVTLADRSRGIFFRSVPSAGGLYPCQLYLSGDGAAGIDTGVYYCDLVQGFLGKINSRPLDTAVVAEGQAHSGTGLVITGIFYHAAWKYRERAFRYLLLDAGHLGEAVVNAARAVGAAATLCYDFGDRQLGKRLGLDASQEVPLAYVRLGHETSRGPDVETIPSQSAEPVSVEPVPIQYAILENAFQAGSAIASRRIPDTDARVFQKEPVATIAVPTGGKPLDVSFVHAVFHRRSRRNFTTRTLSCSVWARFLEQVFTGMGAGQNPLEPGAAAKAFLVTAMICQNLEGLSDGIYAFSQDGSTMACMEQGAFAQELARVCLDQAWISRAAMNFLFLADLAAVEAALGARGYRHVMMHAGRAGQRIYMAAQELELGCCGIGAMYDKEAVELLDLQSGSVLLYAVSAGPVKNKGYLS